jgi:mannosyltransferase
VPPDDAAALTQALEAWVDNPARLAAGGLAARAHILANHQIEGEARALVSIYRDMLAAP